MFSDYYYWNYTEIRLDEISTNLPQFKNISDFIGYYQVILQDKDYVLLKFYDF